MNYLFESYSNDELHELIFSAAAELSNRMEPSRPRREDRPSEFEVLNIIQDYAIRRRAAPVPAQGPDLARLRAGQRAAGLLVSPEMEYRAAVELAKLHQRSRREQSAAPAPNSYVGAAATDPSESQRPKVRQQEQQGQRQQQQQPARVGPFFESSDENEDDSPKKAPEMTGDEIRNALIAHQRQEEEKQRAEMAADGAGEEQPSEIKTEPTGTAEGEKPLMSMTKEERADWVRKRNLERYLAKEAKKGREKRDG